MWPKIRKPLASRSFMPLPRGQGSLARGREVSSRAGTQARRHARVCCLRPSRAMIGDFPPDSHGCACLNPPLIHSYTLQACPPAPRTLLTAQDETWTTKENS